MLLSTHPPLLSSCPPFIVATLLLFMYILIICCQILAAYFLEFKGCMFAGGEETDGGGDARCCRRGRTCGAASQGHGDADDGCCLWTWMDHDCQMGVGCCTPLMGSLLAMSCCQVSDGIGELVVVHWARSADLRCRWWEGSCCRRGKKVLLAVASTGRGRLASIDYWTEEAWLVWICCRHQIAPPWPDLAVTMGEVLVAVKNQKGGGRRGNAGNRRMHRKRW